MSEPEIARRCPSCGASIREKAFFCPQCGHEITKSAQDPAASLHDTHEIIRDGVTLTEADFQARPMPRPKSQTEKAAPARVDAPSEKPGAKPKGHVGRAREEVGARLQRATTKARDVEDNVVQRVQKFREISSVVIDEAGYDPSLRFVLVAAVLFILFLVIVLLNKLIG
jgi:hypothetical protein